MFVCESHSRLMEYITNYDFFEYGGSRMVSWTVLIWISGGINADFFSLTIYIVTFCYKILQKVWMFVTVILQLDWQCIQVEPLQNDSGVKMDDLKLKLQVY